MKRTMLLAVAVLLLLAPSFVEAEQQRLEGDEKKQAEQMLDELLMNQRLVAKVSFPAWKSGIDLNIDGTWDQDSAEDEIMRNGLGVAIDDPALVTDVVLWRRHIEVHLNGGGRGTFGDFLSDFNDAVAADTTGTTGITGRERYNGEVEGLRQPGGSRINLRFDRDITAEDMDPEQLIAYLETLVDASALRQSAFAASIPEEFREAAERGEVISGMDKQTVFAVLGEPVQKHVDLETSPPTERWQYERSDLSTVVVTFVAGKVEKVDIF